MATLFLVATPVGNLEDLSRRAERVLRESDVLACEDTRHTRILMERYGIAPPAVMLAYHEHNEAGAAQAILNHLRAGRSVAVVTNAGMPLVSDPGYRAAAAAIAEGISVEAVPGPSAPLLALVVSGLPVSSFTFKGFAPRSSGRRRNWFASEKDLPHTLIYFEAPGRVAESLGDALAALGDRQAAVCLELTKKFERVRRGFLSELAAHFAAHDEKGEVTICIAGNNRKFMRCQGSAAEGRDSQDSMDGPDPG